MKTAFMVLCFFAVFGSLNSINVAVYDPINKFYLATSLKVYFTVNRLTGSEKDTLIISNATANLTKIEANDTLKSVHYGFQVVQDVPSLVSHLELDLEMKSSSDGFRRFIEEFTVTAKFGPSNTSLANWTDIPLTFIVRPPRFPHFQVKTDWKYNCPVELRLPMCLVENGTCLTKPAPSELLSVQISMTGTTFSGGKDATHDYKDKTEDCPLIYETRQDIGIACIVAFWSIALAVILWGVVKYLMKRHRKRFD